MSHTHTHTIFSFFFFTSLRNHHHHLIFVSSTHNAFQMRQFKRHSFIYYFIMVVKKRNILVKRFKRVRNKIENRWMVFISMNRIVTSRLIRIVSIVKFLKCAIENHLLGVFFYIFLLNWFYFPLSQSIPVWLMQMEN